MSQSGQYNMGLIGPSIDTLTGDNGIAVPGDASANINIIGNPCFDVNGDAATHTLTLTDLSKLSCYVVSNDATETRFTSVQTAIDQAVTDGAAAATPATVYIWNGSYTENITFAPYVNVIGVGSASGQLGFRVTINGVHTMSGNAGHYYLKNVYLNNSTASTTLSVGGASSTRIILFGCAIGNSSTGKCIEVNNASTFYYSYSTNYYGNNTSAAVDVISLTAMEFQDNYIGGVMDLVAPSGLVLQNSEFYDTLNHTAATSIQVVNSYFSTGSNACIDTAAGSTINVQNCELISNSAGGYYLTGSGSGRVIGCSIIGSAQRIDPSFTEASSNYQETIGLVSYNDFTFDETIAAVNRTVTIRNSDNTSTSSQATAQLTVGGGSAGDAATKYTVTGAQSWTHGIDNSDSDAFVVAASTALGTTNVMRASTAGEINYPLQPCFLAVLASADNNVTGNAATYVIGTNVALSSIYDQNSDITSLSPFTFTAPVTGRYELNCLTTLAAISVIASFYMSIITSNRTYQYSWVGMNATTNAPLHQSVIADMDSGDTCQIQIYCDGLAGNTVDLLGVSTTDVRTYVSGKLVA